jgi:hypothetical protein
MGREDKIERLLAYLRGELKKSEARLLEREIETDPELKETYTLLKELGGESRNVDWGEIGSTVKAISDRLVDDFFRTRPDGKSIPGVLVYDSKMLPLPAGVRPASVDVRRLKFKIEEMELMISLYPVGPKAYEIMGQLSGYAGSESIEVSLAKGKKTYRTEPDAFQLFHFARVPSGDYHLVLSTASGTIADVDIDV